MKKSVMVPNIPSATGRNNFFIQHSSFFILHSLFLYTFEAKSKRSISCLIKSQ